MKKTSSKDHIVPIPKSVDEYLSNLPVSVRDALSIVREAVKTAAPQAEEIISYQIPTYKYHGALVHFLARKNYCSFIAVSKSVLTKFAPELAAHNTSGTTIHFTPDRPLSAAMVKKIVKARMAENESRKMALSM